MSDKFEQWFVDNKDRLHLTDRIAARNVWNAALSSLQGEAPKGFALVPIKPTREMERVFREEDWEWRDVLAAAESITEEDYYATTDSAAKIAELDAKLAEVEKDAERYRMLRSLDVTPYNKWDKVQELLHRAIDSADTIEMVDTAVDAAIQESKKGNHDPIQN